MGDGCLCLGAGLGDVPVQTCSCILRGEETFTPWKVRRDEEGRWQGQQWLLPFNGFFLFLQTPKELCGQRGPAGLPWERLLIGKGFYWGAKDRRNPFYFTHSLPQPGTHSKAGSLRLAHASGGLEKELELTSIPCMLEHGLYSMADSR